MMNSLYRWIPIFTVTAMCLVTAACSADSDTDETASDQAASEYGTDGAVEPTEGPGEDEMAEGGDEPATAETGGEHDEAGEGREAGEHAGSESGGEHGGGEHDEGGAGEGEESGVYVGVTKTWDSEQNGARLVLKFYPDRGVVGSVNVRELIAPPGPTVSLLNLPPHRALRTLPSGRRTIPGLGFRTRSGPFS